MLGGAVSQMVILPKTLVLVGLMGAGKSAIGKRLAEQWNVTFVDSDEEIEKREGITVSEIFANHGEPEFRRMEREVIAHDLKFPPHILATGGGAFIQPETRELIRKEAISVWLKADIEVLLDRVSRKHTRPLLEQGDKRATLEKLMRERYPVYEQADIVVNSDEQPHAAVLDKIAAAVQGYITKHA